MAFTHRVGCLVAAACLLAGCGSTGSGPSDNRPSGFAGGEEVPFGTFGRADVATRAESPVLSLGDEQFVVDAQEELTRRCMTEASLPYAPIRERAHEPLRRLGPLPPAVLRQRGYRDALPAQLAPSPLLLQIADLFDGATNDELIGQLSSSDTERWFSRLHGTDDSPAVRLQLPDGTISSFALDSCYSEAITTLFGSMDRFINYEVGGMFMQRAAIAAMHRSPRFQEAHAGWRACLASAGWQIEPLDPNDPDLTRSYPERVVEQAYRDRPVEEADRRHRQLADADTACQEETEFDTAVAEASRDALSAAAAEFGYDLLGRQELLQDAVRNARVFLGAEG